MTRAEALKIMQENKRDFSAPLLKQRVLRGLTILGRYDDNLRPGFGHDRIWVGDFTKTIEQMTQDEIIEMARCDWFESEDSWSHF
jgi:hypothetical protein